jgi:hypothetical protein
MPVYTVTKIKWGRFQEFTPRNLQEVQEKINEIYHEYRSKDYAALTSFELNDQSIYVSFSLGNNISFLEFIYGLVPTPSQKYVAMGPYRLINLNVSEEEDDMFLFDCGGSSTAVSLRECIPYKQMLEAFYTFLEGGKFPPYIVLNDIGANELYVEKAQQ